MILLVDSPENHGQFAGARVAIWDRLVAAVRTPFGQLLTRPTLILQPRLYGSGLLKCSMHAWIRPKGIQNRVAERGSAKCGCSTNRRSGGQPLQLGPLPQQPGSLCLKTSAGKPPWTCRRGRSCASSSASTAAVASTPSTATTWSTRTR